MPNYHRKMAHSLKGWEVHEKNGWFCKRKPWVKVKRISVRKPVWVEQLYQKGPGLPVTHALISQSRNHFPSGLIFQLPYYPSSSTMGKNCVQVDARFLASVNVSHRCLQGRVSGSRKQQLDQWLFGSWSLSGYRVWKPESLHLPLHSRLSQIVAFFILCYLEGTLSVLQIGF